MMYCSLQEVTQLRCEVSKHKRTIKKLQEGEGKGVHRPLRESTASKPLTQMN